MYKLLYAKYEIWKHLITKEHYFYDIIQKIYKDFLKSKKDKINISEEVILENKTIKEKYNKKRKEYIKNQKIRYKNKLRNLNDKIYNFI